MSLLLPFVPSVANYRFATTLEGIVYIFDVHWNTREEFWYMNVLDEDAGPIVSSLKIVLGTNLGARVVDPRFPPGVLQAADTTGQGNDAGFDDLGDRVQVFYIPVAEVLA